VLKKFSNLTLLVTLFICFEQSNDAQSMPDIEPDTEVTIGKIYVTGNKKTLESIILRELNFEEGQTIKFKDFKEIVELDQQKLFNTTLFNKAEIIPLFLDENHAEVLIRVQERWYIFPVPVFRLADRNFTEWWVNQNRDFSRVNYGMQLFHLNFSGRNDKLVLKTQFGFTKQYSFRYTIPYINKAQTTGLSISTSFSTNKAVSYGADRHRIQFIESENTIRRIFSTSGAITYRPSFYNQHTFSTGYSRSSIADTVFNLNREYFGNNSILQEYFTFFYSFVHDRRDYQAYPLTGSRFSASLRQTGLGVFDDIDILSSSIDFSTYTQLSKKLFWANSFNLYKALADEVPYLVRSGFGYNPNFIRGYERYVIESDFLGSYRSSLRFQLLKGVKNLNPNSIIDQFRTLPYAFYLKIFMDTGFAGNSLIYNDNDFYNNELIGSIGVGLDVVTFYDFVIRLEYSLNRQGETGFFVNFRSAF